MYQNTADVLMDILSGRGKRVDGQPYGVSDVLEYWQQEKHRFASSESKIIISKEEGSAMLRR